MAQPWRAGGDQRCTHSRRPPSVLVPPDLITPGRVPLLAEAIARALIRGPFDPFSPLRIAEQHDAELAEDNEARTAPWPLPPAQRQPSVTALGLVVDVAEELCRQNPPERLRPEVAELLMAG